MPSDELSKSLWFPSGWIVGAKIMFKFTLESDLCEKDDDDINVFTLSFEWQKVLQR